MVNTYKCEYMKEKWTYMWKMYWGKVLMVVEVVLLVSASSTYLFVHCDSVKSTCASLHWIM